MIMTPPVTLKQLAELLQLAPSTVSRALKGHPDISSATQAKVRALAQQLRYRPSALALSLRNQRSHLIAVIVPELTDYFYACVVSRMLAVAYQHLYKVILLESHEDYNQEVSLCYSLQKSGIDGLIIAPAKTTTDAGHLKVLKAEGIPVVFFDRMVGDLDIDRVLDDDYYGAYKAVGHMIQGGCKKIGHLAVSQRLLWAQKRNMGYKQALLKHHFEVDRNLIVEFEQLSEVGNIIKILIQEFHIDGIFAVNDASAIRALLTVHQLGYRVPQEIAICGFGNDPVTQVTFPALTTVDRNCRQIGEIAMGLLFKRIKKKDSVNTETRLLKGELIVRESTRIATID